MCSKTHYMHDSPRRAKARTDEEAILKTVQIKAVLLSRFGSLNCLIKNYLPEKLNEVSFLKYLIFILLQKVRVKNQRFD